ncbi:MAG: hypothetical protein R2941_15120 [Desulfobacterales bacterium]
MRDRIIKIGSRLDMGQILAGIRKKGMQFSLLYRFFSPASGMLPDLHALISSLEGVMEKVEPQFLRIGMELRLYADAKHLSDLTVDVAKSIGGTERSKISSAALTDLPNSPWQICRDTATKSAAV